MWCQKVRGQGVGRKSPGYRGIWWMKDRQCFTVVSTAVIYLCAKRMLSRSSSLPLFFSRGASGVHMFIGSSVFGNWKKCANLIVYLFRFWVISERHYSHWDPTLPMISSVSDVLNSLMSLPALILWSVVQWCMTSLPEGTCCTCALPCRHLQLHILVDIWL